METPIEYKTDCQPTYRTVKVPVHIHDGYIEFKPTLGQVYHLPTLVEALNSKGEQIINKVEQKERLVNALKSAPYKVDLDERRQIHMEYIEQLRLDLLRAEELRNDDKELVLRYLRAKHSDIRSFGRLSGYRAQLKSDIKATIDMLENLE